MSSEGGPGSERRVCARSEPCSCEDVGLKGGGRRFGGSESDGGGEGGRVVESREETSSMHAIFMISVEGSEP